MARSIALSLLPALSLVVGCNVPNGTLPTTASSTVSAAKLEPDVPSAPVRAMSAICSNPVGSTRRDQVCHRWSCERDVSAPPWTGDAATCNAGSVDADGSARAQAILDVHRFLADLPPVGIDLGWETAAQSCALVAHANAQLSHHPPQSWSCWSELASQTSAVSLIANRAAPASVEAFFEDPGNETTMVHRRWLLDGALATIAIGSTNRYTCIVVDGRELGRVPSKAKAAAPARTWAAWPPAGPVPMGVFAVERLDTAGWTVQSSEDLGKAPEVTVTEGGTSLPVTTTTLLPYEGSRSAVRFVPKGWSTEAGHTYAVRVSGKTAPDIDFVVEPVACP